MNNYALIQARVSSTRLRAKVLESIEGHSILEHVIRRVRASQSIRDLIVVTTISPDDIPIVRLCAESGIRVSCGSEDDVLDRYYQCAKLLDADSIVRITSDCPFMDPLLIDHIVETHISGAFDYTSNTLEETFPDGLDIEVMKFDALAKAANEASLPSDREHVTPYIKTHPELFKLHSVLSDIDRGTMRWTLDEPRDLDFIKAVYKELYSDTRLFTTDEILQYLSENPQVAQLNSGILRNEGYLKSLKKDKNATGTGTL